MSLLIFGCERRIGVGTGIFNVFVLISYQLFAENNWTYCLHSNPRYVILTFSNSSSCFNVLQTVRINKHGSQKDQEQKKNGNYFFYDADDGAEDDGDFDDI